MQIRVEYIVLALRPDITGSDSPIRAGPPLGLEPLQQDNEPRYTDSREIHSSNRRGDLRHQVGADTFVRPVGGAD